MSALGIVEYLPRLHGHTVSRQSPTDAHPSGQEQSWTYKQLSSEAMSDSSPIRSGPLAQGPTNPLTAWWIANSMLSCDRSRLHSKGREAQTSTRDTVSLWPRTSSLHPSSMGQPAAPGKQLSHCNRCQIPYSNYFLNLWNQLCSTTAMMTSPMSHHDDSIVCGWDKCSF